MRALTWQSDRQLSVETVDDPRIVEPTDAIVRITSTAICGSDLHLYDVLGPFLDKGDVLGHEPMGVVEEVGASVTRIKPGDRVVVPFVIACGECFMCRHGRSSQCETTQQRDTDSGAALYGYTRLYGSIPGGQAEALRVHRADFNLIKVGGDLPDERYLFLSDILPTAWQGVQYADVPEGGTLAVVGLGPVGQLAVRIGRHLGYRVLGVDPVPERRAMAEKHGAEVYDGEGEVAAELRKVTNGRGPDAVLDAVGMEAHGNPIASLLQNASTVLPAPVGRVVAQTAGVDRLAALELAIDAVQRGGTVSLSGVYAGAKDPLPMVRMFDKGLTLRMGQCNVHRWRDELLPLVERDDDPLGIDDLVTHEASLEEGPEMYEVFKQKVDGCVKVVLHP
ncbi:zinc-dependent alcohol dehydrogenase [Schumannella luteola]|uniref:Threonine dehydrogenase-like Zn-dependent dehydrogenase n=1 Tax=Schumannella luteola TaxID=472059 RepID=A0A852YMI1_9MICO|nr:alcohol dehydrogenase catalytic domain-containing protein [Schumannella luteola]NYG98435.1 threonine dehydrogenase-like Zn-dependent dehydrogenase [Schumannella luteola]TPX01332.1 zinc-binding dehydrogenase [Schumannella luteola]